MPIYKTEITSDNIPSDNPIHQRLLKPYMIVKNEVEGDLLELGCGEGRGVDVLLPVVESYLGLDKINEVVARLGNRYESANFLQAVFPPLKTVSDNKYDRIISFQVIEHIKKDRLFLQEIYRALKPGGMAVITTPNRKMSLSRNPWHIREYLSEELFHLVEPIFDKIEAKGITGNEKVMRYHAENKKSVDRIMRFDILNLQNRLPAFVLKAPYELLNRMNRNNLKSSEDELVASISYDDYLITDDSDNALDLFFYLYKK